MDVLEGDGSWIMNIILLGPPGGGKGTQAQFLIEHHGMRQISTGDLLRAAAKKKSPLGLEVEKYMKAGKLVPDDVINNVMKEALEEGNDGRGLILDGYPRTVQQAKTLDQMVKLMNVSVDHVINFNLSDKEVIRRLSGRRQCRECKVGYHIQFAPPKKEGICDRCGSELFQRSDDKIEVIQERLRVYHEKNDKLVDYYRSSGKLREISGEGSTGDIYKKVEGVLGLSQ